MRAADVECLAERMKSAMMLRDSSPQSRGFNHVGLVASDLTVCTCMYL